MSSQWKVTEALAYLNRAYKSAKWDVRLPWTRRNMKSAQIYCKATAIVTHDGILTGFPRLIGKKVKASIANDAEPRHNRAR